MDLPSAIIFINKEISDSTQNSLKNQLFLDEIISKNEFDSRVIADPNYVNVVHGQNLRIMTILDNFSNYTNRELADVVIFFNQGQITIEKNKFGPPTLSLPIYKLNIWSLLRGGNVSDEVPVLPTAPSKILTECDCNYQRYGLGGIVAIELRDTGIIACKNPDNIYNNIDFINRK